MKGLSNVAFCEDDLACTNTLQDHGGAALPAHAVQFQVEEEVLFLEKLKERLDLFVCTVFCVFVQDLEHFLFQSLRRVDVSIPRELREQYWCRVLRICLDGSSAYPLVWIVANQRQLAKAVTCVERSDELWLCCTIVRNENVHLTLDDDVELLAVIALLEKPTPRLKRPQLHQAAAVALQDREVNLAEERRVLEEILHQPQHDRLAARPGFFEDLQYFTREFVAQPQVIATLQRRHDRVFLCCHRSVATATVLPLQTLLAEVISDPRVQHRLTLVNLIFHASRQHNIEQVPNIALLEHSGATLDGSRLQVATTLQLHKLGFHVVHKLDIDERRVHQLEILVRPVARRLPQRADDDVTVPKLHSRAHHELGGLVNSALRQLGTKGGLEQASH